MTIKLTITGLVQGIGFRPYIKRVADALGIKGNVRNCGGVVEITAEAATSKLDQFVSEIQKAKSANIKNILSKTSTDKCREGFFIIKSDEATIYNPIIPADIATCVDCLREMRDEKNDRYRHPFISCTVCGPRFSIIKKLPYDRCNTVMNVFEMCDSCEDEYNFISDRRAHAQTIACNCCGPMLSYTVKGDAIEQAIKTIKSGGVVAVKDIGGYHFAALAEENNAGIKIREIKNRDKKPFAVMFKSTDEVEEYCEINNKEKIVLESSARPIVLLKKKKDFSRGVCDESDYIGAILPCNPVQYMLVEKCSPLIMTSGNVSGEPIITDNAKIKELREKSDFEILSHNRDIMTSLDDSVCRVVSGRMQMLRRARGYVPEPIAIDMKTNKTVLAAGGDLKAAFCFAKNGYAYMSQYFGDLENSDAYEAWRKSIREFGRMLGMKNDNIICDMHPGYFSNQAFNTKNTLQHHFAHMASVMAEHNLSGRTLGFVFDGTGYGTDDSLWGGEVLEWDNGFKRKTHLAYITICGGDAAAKNAAALADCYKISAGLEPENLLIQAAVKNKINVCNTSSMGRLFDAVSAILGICKYNSYEGECAIKLEQAAARAQKAYPLKLELENSVWNTEKLFRDIMDAKADINEIALGFHYAIINAVREYANCDGCRQIILSGGVFANRILTEGCIELLEKDGFRVYINEKVPTNDGGIALGQAWYMANGVDF